MPSQSYLTQIYDN